MNNKVVKNASWIIGARILQSIMSFFIGMLTARYLGPSNYGLISYAASITAFLVPFMQLGLNNILVQQFIDFPDKEGVILGSSLAANLISAFLCILGIITFCFLTAPSEIETIIVCSLYSLILVFQALELFHYWFQAHYLAKYPSIISLIVYVIVASYKAFLLITGKSIYWFAVSNALDYCLISIGLIIIYKKLGGKKLEYSFSEFKRMFSSSRYYIISSLMVTIFAQTDKIMLKFMLGTESTGYYSVAATCASMTSFIFVAILDSYRPLVFESKKEGIERFELNMERLYSVIFYFSLIQCIFFALCSRWIILIIYGTKYAPAIDVLRIIVWYTTFSYLGSVRNIWMLAEGKQKFLWIINLSGALFNVVLNFFLIQLWGVNGAAIASLATQLFTNVFIGYIIKPIRDNTRLMIKGLNPIYCVDIIKSVLKRRSR